VIDRIFNIYEGGVRYGIKAAEIFYSGTTYFAASLIFIITILTAFYRKRNTIYIAASLLMLVMTLRSKAFGAALCYMCLVFFIFKIRKKIKIWHIAAFGIFVIDVAWNNIYFYYVLLAGKSARSVMTLTSLQILKDYFPIGTGFGTYASHAAAVSYSPVYVMYGFQDIWELSNQNVDAFFDDTFWPIIIAQTGFIGIISYLIVLWNVIKKCFNLWEINRYFYAAALFVIAYLLISSIGEPAFNNSISIPLAVSLGVIFRISATNREDYQRLAEVNVSV
ncbi:MAG: hypothetical protein LUG83_09780, partial [Lachnospiraceae bacterium]|nr:hypothetical protein [Lachnospiraceae bacterium]